MTRPRALRDLIILHRGSHFIATGQPYAKPLVDLTNGLLAHGDDLDDIAEAVCQRAEGMDTPLLPGGGWWEGPDLVIQHDDE